jgi:hypothetical protein
MQITSGNILRRRLVGIQVNRLDSQLSQLKTNTPIHSTAGYKAAFDNIKPQNHLLPTTFTLTQTAHASARKNQLH